MMERFQFCFIFAFNFNLRRYSWAERKSRLADLDGFRFFTLMRRVQAEESAGVPGPPAAASDDDEYDYVSLTIWEDKPSYDSWRTSDDFKQAHGGVTADKSGGMTDKSGGTAEKSGGMADKSGGTAEKSGGMAEMMKGRPIPAFYDGLLPAMKAPPADSPWTAVGGRDVQADGVTPIDADVFVVGAYTRPLFSST